MKKNYFIYLFVIIYSSIFICNSSFSSSEDTQEDIWLLSISGGGVRGRMAAAILDALEKQVGRPVHQLFNAIAGTSTGSLIGTGFVMPDETGRNKYTAEDIGTFYDEQSPTIFKKKTVSSLVDDLFTALKKGISFTGPLYEAANLKSVLRDLLGDTPMSQSLCRLFVTGYDSGKRENLLFDSFNVAHGSLPLRKVARASCAAPTCFSPCSMHIPGESEKRSVMDGCMYAIDPALAAFRQLRQENPTHRIRVVSLQTGIKSNGLSHENAQDMGSIGFAPWVIETAFKAQKDQVRETLSDILRAEDYFYFDARLDADHLKLDDAQRSNLQYLRQKGEQITQEDEAFKRLVDIFKERFI